jgi:hypothetical protein
MSLLTRLALMVLMLLLQRKWGRGGLKENSTCFVVIAFGSDFLCGVT